MANWIYTIKGGKALHEAIENEDEQLVVKCLLQCYRELYGKLSDEDKEWKGWDIEDEIETLTHFDADCYEDDDIDYYLDEFYDLCDDLRAWITI